MLIKAVRGTRRYEIFAIPPVSGMCPTWIHLYKIEEDQAAGWSQILRIDPNLAFLNRCVETVLFSL